MIPYLGADSFLLLPAIHNLSGTALSFGLVAPVPNPNELQQTGWDTCYIWLLWELLAGSWGDSDKDMALVAPKGPVAQWSSLMAKTQDGSGSQSSGATHAQLSM